MATTPVKRTYLYAVGRRKTAVARIRLTKKGQGEITVNGKPYTEYFQKSFHAGILKPLSFVTSLKEYAISARVAGGGKAGQATAVGLGIARVLLQIDESARANMKTAGLLTRDSRKKERKKPGLKRARRSPQWSKR